MIDWRHASLEEVGAFLDAQLERQRAAFHETTAASYAAEQRAPDPDDDCEDYG